MPVDLLNPEDLDPNATHRHDIDTEIRVGENWGTIFDRGYTVPGGLPTYAYICDDNIQRSCVESDIDEVHKA